MEIMNFKKCSLCNAETRGLELPVIRFNFLQEAPGVCEKCVAQKLGIAAEWLPVIAQDIKKAPPDA